MNQNEENRFNMYNAVDAVFESNAEVVTQLPALGEVQTDLHSLIEQIKIKNGELAKATEGKTSEKSKAVDELIAAAVPAASAVKAYSARNSLLELKAVVDYSGNQMKRMTQAELPIKIKNIKDAAQGVLTFLDKYGITQAKLDVIDAKLAALAAASGSKDAGFADRSALREALYKLFDSVDLLLKEEADEIAAVLKEQQPDFYNRYFSARVIKDLGGKRSNGDDKPAEQPKS